MEVAAFAPVIMYDRAGIGHSPPAKAAPTLERGNARLHALLAALKVAPPYVLVGHSWGGPLIQSFAAKYPTEVAGLVLVDPTETMVSLKADIARYGRAGVSAKTYRRFYRTLTGNFDATPPGVKAELEVIETFRKSGAKPGLLTDLPPIPLAIFVAGRMDPFPGFEQLGIDFGRLQKVLIRDRMRNFAELALSSPLGTMTVVSNSGHFVHRVDQQLVADGIRRAVLPQPIVEIHMLMAQGRSVEQALEATAKLYPEGAVSEATVNQRGYQLAGARQMEPALAAFELNARQHPKSPNAHDSLAEGYAMAGRFADALESQKKATELAEATEGVDAVPYRARLEKLRKMTAAKK